MKKSIFVISIVTLSIIISIALTGIASASGERIGSKEFIFHFKKLDAPHSASMVELPDGELFVVWKANKPNDGEASIWCSRKFPGALKWTTPEVLYDTAGFADKNPVLYLSKDKRLFLFWTFQKSRSKWHEDKVWVKTSDDLGKTWTEARDIGASLGSLTKSPPVELDNGWLILPIYIDWCTSSATMISKDGGNTWGDLKYIMFLLGTQPTIIERADSSLYVLMRSGMPPRRAWKAVSKDHGMTWRGQGISNVINPGSSLQMLKLKNGHVVMAFNNSQSRRNNLSLALSCDEGKTWPYVRAIEDDKGFENSYPALMQDKDGLIHVVYSAHDREVIAHFVADEGWIKAGADEASK